MDSDLEGPQRGKASPLTVYAGTVTKSGSGRSMLTKSLLEVRIFCLGLVQNPNILTDCDQHWQPESFRILYQSWR
jgi:hypothetical protein